MTSADGAGEARPEPVVERARRPRWPGLLAAAALVTGPALFALLATPLGHSYGFNMAWATGFAAALADGALSPRHLPGLWLGLGGLDFFFYAPLPFFLGAAPQLALGPEWSVHTLFAAAAGLLWALASITFYRLARRFTAPGPAALGALVYAVLPYHLAVDWFIRQAVGEFAAYVFLPVVAGGIVDVLRHRGLGLGLPLGFAGLLLSHLPSAFLAGHLFTVVVGVWAVGHRRAALPAIARLVLGVGLGLAAAAAFWLPAMVLLGDVSPQALRIPHLSPENWLFFDDRLEPDPQLMGVVGAALAGALAAAWLAAAFATPRCRFEVALWTVLPIGVAALMMTAPARPLWESLPIAAVQFPYRLMILVDLSSALACAVLVDAAARARRPARLAAVAAVAAPLAATAIAAGPALDAAAGGRAVRGTAVAMTGAVEYLPPDFGGPILTELDRRGLGPWEAPRVVVPRLPEWRAGAAGAGFTVAPRRWTLDCHEGCGAGPIDLAVPFWRHLRAKTEAGDPVALAAAPATGLVRLRPPPDARRVVVTLPLHWSERAGLAASAVGLVGIAWLGVVVRRGRTLRQ